MLRVVVALSLVVFIVGSTLAFTTQESPRYTIKQVMKKVHGKPSLLNKIKQGKGTEADKATLLEYYESMPLNTPKKGDPAVYKKMAEALVVAATALKNGDKDAMAKLNKATNCNACHNLYK